MPWNRPLIIGLLLLLLALAWWRMPPENTELRRSRLMMGTVVEILLAGEDTEALEKAADAAFAEMARLEKLLSRHQPDSDVNRLSQSSNGGEVAPETAAVIKLGRDLAIRSNGAFDMTLGRVKVLWGFDLENPRVPDRDAIKSALTGIGPEALSLDGLQVKKAHPLLMIDLGGIAKGYVVDQAIAVLKQHGVSSGAINAGGDMYLLGQRPNRPWRIGIQHPRRKEPVLATLQISDRAVVTSGDYERFFEEDGQRYHHIFDPATGSPARLCQSVTVIADTVAFGDALATALFVLGPEAGMELLAGYPGAEGLIVAADGSQHQSPGWSGYLVRP